MAAATASYKRILQLLEKWPLEEGKAGRYDLSHPVFIGYVNVVHLHFRDLGEFLRNKVNLAYKQDKFMTNQKYWDSQYISLQRLVNNDYKNKYPRALTSSATGLTAEQCKLALSNEFLQELQEEDTPFYKKWSFFQSKNK